ncbi:MAG: hypothetical protein PHV50_08015 [Syntrophaceticus sp.]|nr:hypothetical protein [Syntrophaceticus sp.]
MSITNADYPLIYGAGFLLPIRPIPPAAFAVQLIYAAGFFFYSGFMQEMNQ